MDQARKIRQKLQGGPIDVGVQTFSSLKRQGIDEAHRVLDDWLRIDT